MILLDTNVVSALIGPQVDPAVDMWIDAQASRRLATTAITIFELRRGVAMLPEGRRRRRLDAALTEFLAAGIGDRVVPLDRASAERSGELAAARKAAGRTIDLPDTLIAGIAIANRATLATRNARHFADLPTPVVDPWATA